MRPPPRRTWNPVLLPLLWRAGHSGDYRCLPQPSPHRPATRCSSDVARRLGGSAKVRHFVAATRTPWRRYEPPEYGRVRTSDARPASERGPRCHWLTPRRARPRIPGQVLARRRQADAGRRMVGYPALGLAGDQAGTAGPVRAPQAAWRNIEVERTVSVPGCPTRGYRSPAWSRSPHSRHVSASVDIPSHRDRLAFNGTPWPRRSRACDSSAVGFDAVIDFVHADENRSPLVVGPGGTQPARFSHFEFQRRLLVLHRLLRLPG